MMPYEILGVDVKATPEEIRVAYRAKVKSCHPDLGGDPIAFNELQSAYDILSNPDSRAFYDATGEKKKTGSELDQQAVSILTQIMLAIVSDTDLNLQTSDVVDIMGKNVATLIENIESIIEKNGEYVNRLESLRDRLSVKGAGLGNDPLSGAIAKALADAAWQTAGAQELRRVRLRAQAILKGYGYEFTRAIAAPVQVMPPDKPFKPNLGNPPKRGPFMSDFWKI